MEDPKDREDAKDREDLYGHVANLIAKHGSLFTINVVVIVLAVAALLSQCGSGS